MKKTPLKNTKTTKKIQNSKVKAADKPVAKKACTGSWSLSIYVYWFIILFFIAATFYILGRSHDAIYSPSTAQISEEQLLQANDYFENGKTKLLAGNIDDALADLTTAIDSGAASIDTFILRGEAYMQAGDYRNAMADFDKALEKDSQNAVAYYDRALLNMRLEDYNAALNDINNAMAANTTNPTPVLQLRDLYAKRGQLNLWLKNWEGAIADYTNSLARPEGVVNPTVYGERAEAYTAIGNYVDAINDYSSAVRVISEQIQGAPTMSERESLSTRAMDYFEKSAALNVNLGNMDAARSDLESARTIGAALGDGETVERLDKLLSEIDAAQPVEPTPEVPVETTPEVPAETAVTE